MHCNLEHFFCKIQQIYIKNLNTSKQATFHNSYSVFWQDFPRRHWYYQSDAARVYLTWCKSVWRLTLKDHWRRKAIKVAWPDFWIM